MEKQTIPVASQCGIPHLRNDHKYEPIDLAAPKEQQLFHLPPYRRPILELQRNLRKHKDQDRAGERTGGRMTINEAPFAALCLKSNNHLSVAHVLGDAGNVTELPRELTMEIDKLQTAGQQNWSDACQLGLAAGLIQIGAQGTSYGWRGSGFRLEGDLVITAAHVIPKDKGFDEQGHRKSIWDSDNTLACFAQSEVVKTVHHTCVGVYLVLLKPDEDIAIFRIKPTEKRPSAYVNKPINNFVPLHRLASTATPIVAGLTMWSVGYNGNVTDVPDGGTDWPTYWMRFFEGLPTEKQGTVKEQLDHLDLGTPDAPTFEKFFQPNYRTMTFGMTTSDRQSPPNQFTHTASGWYQRSGSMIGALDPLDGQIWVVGLFRGVGDENKNHNLVYRFTERTLSQIRNLVDAGTVEVA